MQQPTFWQQILQYLYLRKNQNKEKPNLNVRFMHGMNRISIFVFLIALTIWLIKFFTRS